MSAETAVTVTETSDGRFTAVDAATGVSQTGDSLTEALLALAISLEMAQRAGDGSVEVGEVTAGSADGSNDDPEARYRQLSARVQDRVRDGDVDEDVVKDAIRWARSQ